MATTNEITGDVIQSRSGTDNFRSNYDDIFRKKENEMKITSADKVTNSKESTCKSNNGDVVGSSPA